MHRFKARSLLYKIRGLWFSTDSTLVRLSHLDAVNSGRRGNSPGGLNGVRLQRRSIPRAQIAEKPGTNSRLEVFGLLMGHRINDGIGEEFESVGRIACRI